MLATACSTMCSAMPPELQRYPNQTMSDDYQIEIPQSFLALYTDAGRSRPHTALAEVAQRYELCEDLATMLTGTARDMEFSLGITESDVLTRCHRGLVGEGAVVSAPEAQWVLCRLAELLDWPLPTAAFFEAANV
jgi:hypothetical protein